LSSIEGHLDLLHWGALANRIVELPLILPPVAPSCPQLPPDVKGLGWIDLDSESKKKPAIMRASGLHWILTVINLVVIGGLEPGCAEKNILRRYIHLPHPKHVAKEEA
jgi:hypothetical protein